MKKPMLLLLFITATLFSIQGQRIYIEDNSFKMNGQPIYLNGANTPWHKWNDFGDQFDAAWWDNHFTALNEAGINSTRVWFSCDSNHKGLMMGDDGRLEGPTEQFWTDLDSLMAIAKRHKIYIMGALISFDHFKASNSNYDSWIQLFNSNENMDTFAENYAVPLVQRYKDNPYLFSIDVCNEIIWISDTESTSSNAVPWSKIQYLIGKVAQRIHETSEILVCASNYIKYVSPKYNGNKYSNTNLLQQVGDDDAYLDFYKIHYYTWVSRWFSGFHPMNTPKYFQLSDKPCITGEMPANQIVAYNRDSGTDEELMSINDAYEISFLNGWQGSMAWTSNGVDSYGNLKKNLAEATSSFRDKHYDLVYPDTSSNYLSINTNSIELSADEKKVSFTISSTLAWNISTSDSWIEPSAMDGTGDSLITIEILPNDQKTIRVATIQISYANNTKTIQLSQSGKTALIDHHSETIKILPNPVTDKVFIHTQDENYPLHICLYNGDGKMCYNAYLEENQEAIEIDSHLQNGIYYVVCRLNNGQSISQKIVISNKL